MREWGIWPTWVSRHVFVWESRGVPFVLYAPYGAPDEWPSRSIRVFYEAKMGVGA